MSFYRHKKRWLLMDKDNGVYLWIRMKAVTFDLIHKTKVLGPIIVSHNRPIKAHLYEMHGRPIYTRCMGGPNQAHPTKAR